MTAQPSSQAEREDVAREVLAEAMDTCVCPHANEIAFLARHSRDLSPKRTTATIIAAMLAFSDREHATPRSMPEEVVEAPSEDWLADVIDDSLDMGWTGRVGARAIIARWNERND